MWAGRRGPGFADLVSKPQVLNEMNKRREDLEDARRKRVRDSAAAPSLVYDS